MKKAVILSCFFLLILFLSLPNGSFSQNVGIGTTTPNAKAALEVKATDKGILFPRLTSAQRNAITNPPDGLHLYNTDERCLNYYDSLFQVWNCYCETDTCKTVTIHINANATNINFNTTYASQYPGKNRFAILVYPGVTINSSGPAAIDFSTIPGNGIITIINRGNILGNAGDGGRGASGPVNGSCNFVGAAGSPGGPAIITKAGVLVTMKNYGTVSGGGGGGGGGGRNVIGEYGGGGGGGAGSFSGNGGTGGGVTSSVCIPPFGCSCGTSTAIAQSGQPGTLTAGGAGGLGANGAGAGNGGVGGARAQAGQNGSGTAAGAGGAAGKAISGGSGNVITNISGGQSFGVVD